MVLPAPPAAAQAFELRCFQPPGAAAAALPSPSPSPSLSPPPSLRLQGSVGRSGERLSLAYRLSDPDGLVLLPPPAPRPRRADGLWSTTCLEFFLAEPGAPPYWEFNLAPSGDWNAYRLAAYRQGLEPVAAIASLPLQVERDASGLDLRLSLDLGHLLPPGRALELGITAVLELNDGPLLYWALSHPGAEADFHRRDGFLVRI